MYEPLNNIFRPAHQGCEGRASDERGAKERQRQETRFEESRVFSPQLSVVATVMCISV